MFLAMSVIDDKNISLGLGLGLESQTVGLGLSLETTNLGLGVKVRPVGLQNRSKLPQNHVCF